MNDNLGDYLRAITRYPLLTKDQEILLARRVQVWVACDSAKVIP